MQRTMQRMSECEGENAGVGVPGTYLPIGYLDG